MCTTGHLRASVSHLEVAGKIAVPHMVNGTFQILQPYLCPPAPTQHCLVLELDQGYA